MFIAITTYGDPENIFGQVMNMYNKKHAYFIHYNKRESRRNLNALINMFKPFSNVKIISKYKVFWGEFSIVKSVLYCMNKFLESSDDYFIHLGAKEINLHSIEYIEEYIYKNSYTSINYDGKYINWYLDKIVKPEDKLHNDNIEILYKRKFYKSIYRWKDKKIINCIVFIITAFCTNIFTRNSLKAIKVIITNVIKIIFDNKVKNKEIFLHEISRTCFHYLGEGNSTKKSLWWQFSKNVIPPPKKLKNIKFMPLLTVSPYLILDKRLCEKIINYKNIKLFKKYCKKILAPEEIFFNTLLFELVSDLKNNNFSLAFNGAGSLPIIPDFLDINGFLFMRKFQGNAKKCEEFRNSIASIIKK